MTELVFIGMDMDRTDIENRLSRCLLSEEEMKQDWSVFNNPLPWITEE